MQQSDFDQFAACWAQACEGCGKPATPSQINWAFEVIRDKNIDQVKKALIMHARDQKAGQFQPKAADIIKHIDGSHDDRKAAGEYAWQRAYDAIGSAGRYASVAFDDAAIHYALMLLGGWEEFCGMMEDEKPFRRKDFISAYTAYRKGLPYTPYFSGITERENSGKVTVLRITYIGNKQKAIAVVNAGRTGSMSSITCETIVPALRVAA